MPLALKKTVPRMHGKNIFLYLHITKKDKTMGFLDELFGKKSDGNPSLGSLIPDEIKKQLSELLDEAKSAINGGAQSPDSTAKEGTGGSSQRDASDVVEDLKEEVEAKIDTAKQQTQEAIAGAKVKAENLLEEAKLKAKQLLDRAEYEFKYYKTVAGSKIVKAQTALLRQDDLVNLSKANMVPGANQVFAFLQKNEADYIVFLAYGKDRELLPNDQNCYIIAESEAISREVESLFDNSKVVILQ